MIDLKKMQGLIYQYWASCKPGSTAIYESSYPTMEMRITLIAIDSGQVTLLTHFTQNSGAILKEREEVFHQTLFGSPEGENSIGTWSPEVRSTTSSTHKGASLQVLGDPWISGDREIIGLAGEDYICQIHERHLKYSDQDQLERCWVSDKIPGGIVKYERALAGSVRDQWTLRESLRA